MIPSIHEQIIEDTLHVAIQAGIYLKQSAFNTGTHVEWKKTDDPVTTLDTQTEQFIRHILTHGYMLGPENQEGLRAQVIGEEYGTSTTTSEIVAYVDPIDGTKSFVRGEFHSSLSILTLYKERPIIGAVNDFMRGHLYVATPLLLGLLPETKLPGQGLQRYTEHLYQHHIPLPRTIPTFSTLAISVSDDETYNCLAKSKKISPRHQMGSIALSMAQLAAGCYDGLIMQPRKGQPHDVAAGWYLMSRAGLSITDREGRPYDFKHPESGLIATKPDLAGIVMEELAR